MKVCCVDPAPESMWPNNYGVWVDEFEALDLTDCLDYVLAKSRGVFRRRQAEVSGPAVDSHPFALDQMVFMDWRDSHLAPGTPMQKSNADLPTFLYAMPLSPTTVFLEETSLVARPAVAFDEIQRRLEKRLAHLGIKVNAITEQEYCLIPMGGVLPDMPQRVLGIGGTAGMVHPSTATWWLTRSQQAHESSSLTPFQSVTPSLSVPLPSISSQLKLFPPLPPLLLSQAYMVARSLAAAPVVAAAIVKQLEREGLGAGRAEGSDSVSASASGGGGNSEAAGAGGAGAGRAEGRRQLVSKRVGGRVAAVAQGAAQFFCFGMDVLLRVGAVLLRVGAVLLRLDLAGNRRFFDAFFDLTPYQWHGFLSSRLNIMELISFGLSLFKHASNPARIEIMAKGLPGLGTLIQNVVKMRV
ncbi:unnamed protein product [Closterium sp. NIES-65]|nr:unnamed protein product [Closterium sp. NIES-65]